MLLCYLGLRKQTQIVDISNDVLSVISAAELLDTAPIAT
jgi:hypothetical protein